jgi:anti-sigma factor ChrR (cupin superfamily)
MFKLVSRLAPVFSAAVVLAALPGNTAAQDQSKKTAEPKTAAVETKKSDAPAAFIGTPDKIKWSQMAPGVELGAVYGDCNKPGAPCVFQLRFAAGGKIPPHWHPVDEHVTVLSGDFRAGMGDTLDESKMVALPAGSYVLMPRRMHHYAMAKSAALVQVHGVGPFKIIYINPADDPSKAAAKSAD